MNQQNQTFEQNMLRLEQIVRAMERGDVALEESLKLFQEGTELVRSCQKLLDLLPPELHEIEGSYLTGSVLNDAERKLLKAADRLSALIKCMEEVESGNREFTAALAQQKADLAAMHSPEADYFIEHMLPCYTQNLDELTRK